MWIVCKKEWQQFFSSLTGYIIIIVFLLVNGIVLFVFENNIFDYGYATLDQFFQLAPWVLLFLTPAITMRSFSDEFKSGTYEVQTLPLIRWDIIFGKYLGCLFIAIMALLPSLIYIISIQSLAAGQGLDMGATIGSYIGLVLLAAVFIAIGIFTSSLTSNSVVAFMLSLVGCALLYYGFNAISKLSPFANGADYYIEMAGIDFHYRSISRGVIDTRDIIYFFSVIGLFFSFTHHFLSKHKG